MADVAVAAVDTSASVVVAIKPAKKLAKHIEATSILHEKRHRMPAKVLSFAQKLEALGKLGPLSPTVLHGEADISVLKPLPEDAPRAKLDISELYKGVPLSYTIFLVRDGTYLATAQGYLLNAGIPSFKAASEGKAKRLLFAAVQKNLVEVFQTFGAVWVPETPGGAATAAAATHAKTAAAADPSLAQSFFKTAALFDSRL